MISGVLSITTNCANGVLNHFNLPLNYLLF